MEGELMKNEEITMYELLRLIKDDKAPKKIKFRSAIYYWSFDTYTQNISTPDNQYSLFQEYRIDYCLNDKVEILPENDEWKDINNIDVLQDILSTNKIEVLIENIGDIQIKINQLIKNQKYLKEKLESKDE